MKPAALNQMRRDVWGDLSDEDVLGRLKEFLQASSALSFAARGQQFTDEELRQLRVRAQDYVISLSYVAHHFPPEREQQVVWSKVCFDSSELVYQSRVKILFFLTLPPPISPSSIRRRVFSCQLKRDHHFLLPELWLI